MPATAITDHIVGLRRRPNSTTINASTNIYSNFSNLSASTNAHILLVEQHQRSLRPLLQFYFHQGQLMNSQRIVFIINTRVQCKEPQTSVLCIIDIACLIATVYFIIIRLVESFKLLFFIESVSGGRCRGCQRQRAIRAAGVSHKLLSLLPSLVGIALLFFTVCFALELLFANLYRRGYLGRVTRKNDFFV